MEISIEHDRAPAASWVRVPVTVGGHVRSFPLVIASDPERGAKPCLMYLNWARAQLRYDLCEPAARAWSSFLGYLGAAHAAFPIQGDDLNHLVGSYLLVRYSGTSASLSPLVQRLRWKPASYTVVKRELTLIESILRLASTQLGYVDVGLGRFRPEQVSTSLDELSTLAATAPAERRDDFFLHLRSARMYWAEVHGRHELQLPSIIRRPTALKAVWTCFSTDEVWEIVKRETNFMFRALWLAAGFGGPRIAEQLNAFQVDLLPPSARGVLFPGLEKANDRTILYLRAHPTDSKYTGSLNSFTRTRREYLASRYALIPRPEMKYSPEWRGCAAGWKGTVPTGAHGLHQIMWCNDEAALAFADCAGEIHEFHRRHKTSLRHPWLFVNIGDTEHFGEPIKMSRVKKAFVDACLRAGIDPYTFGRNLHGLRHHYGSYLKQVLQLDDEHIQIAMGHASILSQRNYTKKIVDAHAAFRDRVAN